MKTKLCAAIGAMLLLVMAILSFGETNGPSDADAAPILASPFTVCNLPAKMDSAVCEYDKALNCARGCLKWNDQAQVIPFREDTSPGYIYVNFVKRRYRGYCASGECFGVLYSNIGYDTRQVYATTKRH